jgi:SAM-dependent methyltransferase
LIATRIKHRQSHRACIASAPLRRRATIGIARFPAKDDVRTRGPGIAAAQGLAAVEWPRRKQWAPPGGRSAIDLAQSRAPLKATDFCFRHRPGRGCVHLRLFRTVTLCGQIAAVGWGGASGWAVQRDMLPDLMRVAAGGSDGGETMSLTFISPASKQKLTRDSDAWTSPSGERFAIVDGIGKFVELHYADNFGFQWNTFARTQYDTPEQRQSSNRFWANTAWPRGGMAGENILEAGSGAGRFTDVLMRESQATVYSFDLSHAVTANAKHHHAEIASGRLHLFQASIYDIPLPDQSLDKVFCFGVLQHTPDFRKSLEALYAKVRPGGELVVDFYRINGFWTKLTGKYLLRPFVKNMPHEKMLKLIRGYVPTCITISNAMHAIGLGIFTRFLPIPDIKHTMPAELSKEELKEWVTLDTFDMYSPAYDNPQPIARVRQWLEALGAEITLAEVVPYGGNHSGAVVRCRRPLAPPK